jgi:Transglycosylase SLT domain
MRTRINILLLGVSLGLFTSSEAFAEKKKIEVNCEQYISSASQAQGVPIGILYAVALTETGSDGKLSPYAMNIEGKSFLAKTQAEAILAFQEARLEDKKLIDLGCMQINHFYHQSRFRSVHDMLDPKENVNYAAKLLKTLRKRHGSWTEAVAYYHAGPKNKIAQHRYVCKVLRNMVASHFGEWTPDAEDYCTVKN